MPNPAGLDRPATTGKGSTVGEDGKRPVHIWTTEPEVTLIGKTLTGYRDTAGEAGIGLLCFRDADLNVSEIRETATGYRDTA